jgi:midasin
VRKFRNLLSQPVALILRNGVVLDLVGAATEPLESTVPFPSNQCGDNILPYIVFCRESSIWSIQSRLFLDPLKLSLLIQNIFRRFNTPVSEFPINVSEFVNIIEDLRKQTPSTLTDENEKHVKFLKTQKRRVFAQTMKSLREWGIASKTADQNMTHSANAHRMQSTLLWNTPGNSMQSRIDEKFYRIVDLLPRMRVAGAEHSSDLSDAEFHRAHGYIESLVDGLFEQRNVLIKFDDEIDSLKNKIANTISILANQIKSTDEARYIVSPIAVSYVDSRQDILRRLSVVIGTCISVLEAHKQLDIDANISSPALSLRSLQEECQSWLARSCEVSYNDNILFSDAVDWCNGLDEWLDKVSNDIQANSNEHPDFAYVFKPIMEAVAWANGLEKLCTTEISLVNVDTASFQKAAEALGACTLRATQEISKLLDGSEFIDSASYQQMKTLHTNTIKQLHAPTVMKKVTSVYKSSISLLSSRSGLQHVLAVFNSLLPVLEQYVNGCEQIRHHLSQYHDNFSQMTHVLIIAFYNLATKGYCSPQRSEKESGSTQADGVGLGEGEGETDISNEIEDDEDLADLAERDKAEANEHKEQSDENGVEMEDDFEGALEDGPEKDDEEEEGGDEGDEMEEGMGDVDDTDPSAVDEQFWENQAKQPPENVDEKQTQGKKELEDQKGELGANNKDRELKDKKDHKDEETQEPSEEDIGSEIDESGVQNREDDTMMPEAQPLDLADDLDLSQPDKEGKAESIFSDDEMDIDSEVGDDVNGTDKVVSDNEIEGPSEEELDLDRDGETVNDENMEEETNNAQNVDQSEYQGDDVAASDAHGKGGDAITTDEKPQGSNDEESQQNEVYSEEQTTSNPHDGENGPGDSQTQSQITEKDKTAEQTRRDESKDSNPFRKLGDMLEQWRRDLQNVQDVASEQQNEQKTVGEQNPEFSYVGEEEDFNNQALGPAALDQVQQLDMSMAVDEEQPIQQNESTSTENTSSEAQPQRMDVDTASYSTSFGASIGDRSKDPDSIDIDQIQAKSLDEAPLTTSDTSDIHDSCAVSTENTDDARLIWQQHDRSIHDLSVSLCEQLRLILEPTQATKMRGDFRTGKRLNMRRIIPYIASDYKKDKIWMRRTKPSKRQYQVMIAIDDSKSMSDSKSVSLAFDTLALTAKALTQLEVGQIAIIKFGEKVNVVHSFEEQFTSESGGKVVREFRFDQARTDVCALTRASIELFDVAKIQQNARSSVGELWQLELIISDGICEDHDTVRRLVREAFEAKIMMIFVILDAIHPERKDSILDIKSYSFETGEGGQVLKETRYLDSFPFNYFVIVRDVRELPSVLASALRQWFAEVAER